ncbi:MAG: archaellin/type IV pilin N-terminal domain-containing protein [Candidatus Nanoarchaeia archaeon]|jgi:flagellin-like protein
MKSITPVISVILMILITIIASVSAFFFITSNISDLENQGNLDAYPGNDNSRINVISITGTKLIVRNDGTSPVTDLVVFINDELYNYTLSSPILPGQLKEIEYSARQSNSDLQVKVIYNKGKTAQATSPASKNTIISGFTPNPSPLNPSYACNSSIVNFANNTVYFLSDDLDCGCNSSLQNVNVLTNSGFETGDFTDWIVNNHVPGSGLFASIDTEVTRDDYSVLLNNSIEEAEDMPGIILQTSNYSDNISFWINSNFTGLNNSFIIAMFDYKGEDTKTIIYAMYQNFTEDFMVQCNYNSSDFYVKCIDDLPNNNWNQVTLNPLSDLERYVGLNWGQDYVTNFTIFAGPRSYAYIDDIYYNTTDYELGCECDNQAINPGFETRTLEGWINRSSFEDNQFVVFSSLVKRGSYSILINNSNESFGDFPNVSNTFKLSNEINFYVNSNFTGLNNSFVMVNVEFNNANEDRFATFIYIMYQNLTEPYSCDKVFPGSSPTYLKCINDLTDNNWNKVTFNPLDDLKEYLGIYPEYNSTMDVAFGAGPRSYAYFDDIFINNSYDELGCGCNSSSTTWNNVTNNGFETGDLTDWGNHSQDDEGGFVVMSEDIAKGFYSVLINNTNDTVGSGMPSIYRHIPLSDYVDFWINSNSSEESDSFVYVDFEFKNSSNDEIGYIIYAMYPNLNTFTCNDPNEALGFNYPIYIKCINDLIDNAWNNVIINPISDALEYFDLEIPSDSTLKMSFGAGPKSFAYIDTIFVNKSAEGFKCDIDFDNIADGICINNECNMD